MRFAAVLLMAVASAATFQVQVGVWDDTALRYGGMAEVVPLVHAQFRALNENLTAAGVDAAFIVTRVDRFAGDPKLQAWREHPGCDLYVCYNEDGPAGGYVGMSNGEPFYVVAHNFSYNGMGVFSPFGLDFLRHEIGHFRGMQDLYYANVSALDNPVLPVGHQSVYTGTMAYPYGDPRWSAYSVRVMNGYGADPRLPYPDEPGGHLYGDLPLSTALLLVRPAGVPPLSGTVYAYGMVRGRVEAQSSFTGRIDASGRVALPAGAFGRPGDGGAAGLFILVKDDAGTFFGWLELPQVHEAAWEAGGGAVEIAVELTRWKGARIPLTTPLPVSIIAM